MRTGNGHASNATCNEAPDSMGPPDGAAAAIEAVLARARALQMRGRHALELRAREARLRVRRTAGQVALYALLAVVLGTVVVGTVAMLLFAAASAVASGLALPLWAGCGILSLVVLSLLGGSLWFRQRRLSAAAARARAAAEECAALPQPGHPSSEELVRSLATVPGLLLSMAAGFLAVRLCRNTTVRGLVAAGAARAARAAADLERTSPR